MRLGVVSDIHGNLVAFEAVLADAADQAVDSWWALGDLVLFGPRPVEVLETLADLRGVAYLSGNTDRYVVTGEHPFSHLRLSEASPDILGRVLGMTGAIAWTRGALVQAGLLSFVAELPATLTTELPDGARLLGVHSTPNRDDGAGISTSTPDEALVEFFAGTGASVVVGGHTHDPTDRLVGDLRALNPGSVGLSQEPGFARWLIIETDSDGLVVDLRRVSYDTAAVVSDLYQRGYPNAAYLEASLTGAQTFGS